MIPQVCGDPAKDFVPFVVPAGVVVDFEIIKVRHQENPVTGLAVPLHPPT